MNENGRACIAIDLKSYYASVECVERGLDPLDTNLVVADESRSAGTICLATRFATLVRRSDISFFKIAICNLARHFFALVIYACE